MVEEVIIHAQPHVQQLIRYAMKLGTNELKLYPPNILWFMDSSKVSAGFTKLPREFNISVTFEFPNFKVSEIKKLERIEVKGKKAYYVFKHRTIEVDVEEDGGDPRPLIEFAENRHDFGWLDLPDTKDVLSEMKLMKFSELGDTVAIDFYNGVFAVTNFDDIPGSKDEIMELAKKGKFYDLWNAFFELQDFYINMRVPALSMINSSYLDDIIKTLEKPNFIYLSPSMPMFGPVVFTTVRKDSDEPVVIVVAPARPGEPLEKYYEQYHELPKNVRDFLKIYPYISEKIESAWKNLEETVEDLIKKADEVLKIANTIFTEQKEAWRKLEKLSKIGKEPEGISGTQYFPKSLLSDIETLRKARRDLEAVLKEIKTKGIPFYILERRVSGLVEDVSRQVDYLKRVYNTAMLINRPEEFKEIIKREVPEIVKQYHDQRTLISNIYFDFMKKHPMLKGIDFTEFFWKVIDELIREGVLEKVEEGMVKLKKPPKVEKPPTVKLSDEEVKVLEYLVVNPLSEAAIKKLVEWGEIDPAVLGKLIREGYIKRIEGELALTDKGYEALGGKEEALCRAFEKMLRNSIEMYGEGEFLPRHYGELPEIIEWKRVPAKCEDKLRKLQHEAWNAIKEFFSKIEGLNIRSSTQLESRLRKEGFEVKAEKTGNTYRIEVRKGDKTVGATITCYPEGCTIYFFGEGPVGSYYRYPRHIAYGLVYYYAKRMVEEAVKPPEKPPKPVKLPRIEEAEDLRRRYKKLAGIVKGTGWIKGAYEVLKEWGRISWVQEAIKRAEAIEPELVTDVLMYRLVYMALDPKTTKEDLIKSAEEYAKKITKKPEKLKPDLAKTLAEVEKALLDGIKEAMKETTGFTPKVYSGVKKETATSREVEYEVDGREGEVFFVNFKFYLKNSTPMVEVKITPKDCPKMERFITTELRPKEIKSRAYEIITELVIKCYEELNFKELTEKLSMYNPPYSYPPKGLRERAERFLERALKRHGLDKYEAFYLRGTRYVPSKDRLITLLLESWMKGWNPLEIIREITGAEKPKPPEEKKPPEKPPEKPPKKPLAEVTKRLAVDKLTYYAKARLLEKGVKTAEVNRIIERLKEQLNELGTAIAEGRMAQSTAEARIDVLIEEMMRPPAAPRMTVDEVIKRLEREARLVLERAGVEDVDKVLRDMGPGIREVAEAVVAGQIDMSTALSELARITGLIAQSLKAPPAPAPPAGIPYAPREVKPVKFLGPKEAADWIWTNRLADLLIFGLRYVFENYGRMAGIRERDLSRVARFLAEKLRGLGSELYNLGKLNDIGAYVFAGEALVKYSQEIVWGGLLKSMAREVADNWPVIRNMEGIGPLLGIEGGVAKALMGAVLAYLNIPEQYWPRDVLQAYRLARGG